MSRFVLKNKRKRRRTPGRIKNTAACTSATPNRKSHGQNAQLHRAIAEGSAGCDSARRVPLLLQNARKQRRFFVLQNSDRLGLNVRARLVLCRNFMWNRPLSLLSIPQYGGGGAISTDTVYVSRQNWKLNQSINQSIEDVLPILPKMTKASPLGRPSEWRVIWTHSGPIYKAKMENIDHSSPKTL